MLAASADWIAACTPLDDNGSIAKAASPILRKPSPKHCLSSKLLASQLRTPPSSSAALVPANKCEASISARYRCASVARPSRRMDDKLRANRDAFLVCLCAEVPASGGPFGPSRHGRLNGTDARVSRGV